MKASRRLKLLFAAYGLLMFWLLFLQRAGVPLPGEDYAEQLRAHMNLVPGRTVALFVREIRCLGPGTWHALINLAGNVLMFVPLGFFLPAIWPKLRHLLPFSLLVLACLFLIESLQLFTLLGSFDVDDILLNFIGSLFGFVFWLLTARRYRRSYRPED